VTKYYLIVTARRACITAPGRTMRGSGTTIDRGIEMAARVRRDRLEVHREPEVTDGPPGPTAPDEIPYVEPAQYGLRFGWESEAVRVEAADFLAPSQVQQSSRRRLARAMARMREEARTDP
jgi:hypothetical protein